MICQVGMGIPCVDCWVEKLEALLGVRLGLSENSARKISRVEIRHFNQRPISWRLIAFMNYPYLLAEISWSSGSLLSDRSWTNDQVCSGSVPFRFSKFERGWTNYLLQHTRQHAVLVFLGLSSLVRDGMVFGHLNHRQIKKIKKRDIIYAYVFLQVHAP